MWYLIMLGGIYIVTPIIKEIVKKPPLLKAFFIFSLLFTFAIPTIKDLPQIGGMTEMLKKPIIGALFRAFKNTTDDMTIPNL